MSENTRAVMVGCGSMSAAWLNAVKDLGTVDMVGFVDINEESAKKRRDEYGWTAAVAGDDLKSVLDQVAANVVFDCTIPEAHYGVTMTALGRGINVLGEKPLADSMDHAREMVAEAAKTGKIYAVIQNRRYNPIIRQYRTLVQSGEIGELTTAHSDFFLAPHFGGFRDRMKHVLLLDMAIHTFDEARFITGADPVSVYAREWNPKGSWYDYDASAVCFFTMSNGLIYTYRGSWCAEALNTSWECEWRVIGTNGTALWDGNDNIKAAKVSSADGFVRTHADIAVPPVTEPDKKDGHAGLIREFIECMKTGQKPETIASDNIKSLAMVFGAIESAESGTDVAISW